MIRTVTYSCIALFIFQHMFAVPENKQMQNANLAEISPFQVATYEILTRGNVLVPLMTTSRYVSICVSK
jgi:hypothetical protein